MAVKRGICSHCGKAIKLDDAYKASRCPYCGNIVETWAALKLAAADVPASASERQPSPASHAPQGQGTAPIGPDMRKGECPHCGKSLTVDARSETMICPACRNKFKTAAAIRLASSGAPSAQPRPAANGTSAPAGSSAALASAGAEAYGGDAAVGALQQMQRKRQKIVVAIAVIVVIVIAIIMIATFASPGKGKLIGNYELDSGGDPFDISGELLALARTRIELTRDSARLYFTGVVGNTPITDACFEYTWEITSKDSNGVYNLRFTSQNGDTSRGTWYNGKLQFLGFQFVKSE